MRVEHVIAISAGTRGLIRCHFQPVSGHAACQAAPDPRGRTGFLSSLRS